MKLTIIILLTTILYSCKKNTDSGVPYLKFDTQGKLWLSEMKVSDTIKYLSSTGKTSTYQIFKRTQSKMDNSQCNFTIGNCKIFYYYDVLEIRIARTDTIPPSPNDRLTYGVIMSMSPPMGVDKKDVTTNTIPITNIFGNLFINFNSLPVNSNEIGGYLTYPVYSNATLQTFTNSVRTYSNILILKSGNDSVYTNQQNGYKGTINEVWFDKKYGIVFYKDVSGETWSRIN